MTWQEFKGWFEGYTEAIDGRPSEKQWARICERLGEVVEPSPRFINPVSDPVRDIRPPYEVTCGDPIDAYTSWYEGGRN